MPTEKVFCDFYKFLERLYINRGGSKLLDEMGEHHPDRAGTPCKVCLDSGRINPVDSTK